VHGQYTTRPQETQIRASRRGAGGRSAQEIEVQVRRYAVRFRRPLRRLAEASPRFADLLFSFPAACAGVVTARISLDAAADAGRLVLTGAPLAEVAAALRLPLWLRRLPPEVFDRALPARICARASDAEFAWHIVNLVPERKDTNGWLHWVLTARAICGDEFAVWIAGQSIFGSRRPPPPNALLPLAIFVWFSHHPELAAARLLGARWAAKMGIDRAAYLTRRWLYRVLHDLCLALPASRRVWAQPRQVQGFEFVPLLTSDALADEGVRMRNCLATYTVNVIHGVCRLYSVRCGGASIATMDVRNVPGSGLPAIAQLLAPGNTRAPSEVHEAARAWLTLQFRDACMTAEFNWGTPSDTAFQEHVWQPYASALESSGLRGLPPPTVISLLQDIGSLCALEKS
jgi:hypothetical protein